MTLTVLFCVDPLHPRRVDPHFSREAAAVRDHYGEIALLDHDALQRGDVDDAVRAVPAAWARSGTADGCSPETSTPRSSPP